MRSFLTAIGILIFLCLLTYLENHITFDIEPVLKATLP